MVSIPHALSVKKKVHPLNSVRLGYDRHVPITPKLKGGVVPTLMHKQKQNASNETLCVTHKVCYRGNYTLPMFAREANSSTT